MTKHEDTTQAAGGSPLERGVRPLAGTNLRRLFRANRLLEELGHSGDTLAALEELQRLRAEPRDQETKLLTWAVGRWRAEVEGRPLVNVHRRALDDAWRQVIRFAGGDPDALIGPAHDKLMARGFGAA